MRSERFRRVAIRLQLLVAIVGATGCTQHVYKLYPGPERPAEELARLHVSPNVLGGGGYGAAAIEIDGLRVSALDYQSVEIEPGWHEIRWSSRLGSYWWESRGGGEEHSAVAMVNLEAGEEYAVHVDVQASGWLSPERHYYVWIENKQTGVFVGGEKKP
jgi:hypothetical protein